MKVLESAFMPNLMIFIFTSSLDLKLDREDCIIINNDYN